MTWRHVIKSLLFKPDSQLCVIFTQFTPAFTPRRVELRIVGLFLSLFSRGEAKDQLSVSVVVCLSLSVVVQVWINSEVCPPSWTLLSGAETKLLWPALMKTGRDVTLGWTVTMATATSLRSVFSASVVGSSRSGGSGHCWSEDWWGQNPGPALSTSGSPPWVQILSEDPDRVLTSVQSRTEKLQRLDLLNDAFRVWQKNVPWRWTQHLHTHTHTCDALWVACC